MGPLLKNEKTENRSESLGIGLGFNFENIFYVVKSRRQLALWSSGETSDQGVRFGCWPSSGDGSHCGSSEFLFRQRDGKRLTRTLGNIRLQRSSQKEELH